MECSRSSTSFPVLNVRTNNRTVPDAHVKEDLSRACLDISISMVNFYALLPKFPWGRQWQEQRNSAYVHMRGNVS